jgi:hypothetical protein
VLRLRRTIATLTEGPTRTRVNPLWLEAAGESQEPRALLAAHADLGALSPKGDAVLFTDDSGAWVVPLVRVPMEAYQQARAAAARQKVISSGKQIGLALHLYAENNESTLPGADQPVNQLIAPHVGDDEVFAGFVYTHTGGKLSELADAGKTQLGYIQGEGGRAIIYADGHVTWEVDGK